MVFESWICLNWVSGDGASKLVNNQGLAFRFLTVLRPPVTQGQLAYEPLEWKQIVDLLWSDPRPQPGCCHNGYRGGGCFFGPEVTRSFLERHQLEMLVRSHQCKSDGYEYAHDNKLILANDAPANDAPAHKDEAPANDESVA
ncbi:serine/threonine-protein phosphatase rdgC-like [Stegodyphus dumicola]|uniref:serine/threonine-protein phosphatase rdgC-like n=1 Tax=Stegodyphus dumicola TaxID=202533 RepID=UPI0015ADAC4B|nr:serine/threonine-protein phosphatase rdgC-like [Stegodyphus dumicola]